MNENHGGMLIKQLNDALEKQANMSLKEVDLTRTQIGLLMTLNETAEKKMALKSLEKRLHVSQPTIAGIVSRLEQKGYIRADVSPDDKRVKIAALTGKGIKQCERANNVMNDAEMKIFSGFTKEEKKAFLKQIRRILDNVNT